MAEHKTMKKFAIAAMIGLAATTTATFLVSAPAYGVNFSFTGSFSSDADTQSFLFTADGTSVVNLRAYNYGGGTNAAGTVIPSGGFDPVLFLYDASDTLIRAHDDGSSGTVATDPSTGKAFDSNFSEVLAAGNYRVVMTQFHNFPVGIIEEPYNELPTGSLPTGIKFADGFQQSDPNFTNNMSLLNGLGTGCSNQQFCDHYGYNRTSAWAFDIRNVSQATQATAVPEPADLFGTVLAGFAIIGLKRKLASARKAK